VLWIPGSITNNAKKRCINLHEFRYEGGAPINNGSQIPIVIEKKESGPSYQARAMQLI